MVLMIGFAGSMVTTGQIYLALLCAGIYQVVWRLLLVFYFVRRDGIQRSPEADLQPLRTALREGGAALFIVLGAVVPIGITVGPVADFLTNRTPIADALENIEILTWIPVLITVLALFVGRRELPRGARAWHDWLAGAMPRFTSIGALLFFAVAASEVLGDLGLARDIDGILADLQLNKYVMALLVGVLVAVVAGPGPGHRAGGHPARGTRPRASRVDHLGVGSPAHPEHRSGRPVRDAERGPLGQQARTGEASLPAGSPDQPVDVGHDDALALQPDEAVVGELPEELVHALPRAADHGGEVALRQCGSKPDPAVGQSRAALVRQPDEPCRQPPRDIEEMQFLEPAQINRLAATITDRYRAAIYFAAYGGLRAGELWALRVDRGGCPRWRHRGHRQDQPRQIDARHESAIQLEASCPPRHRL